MSPQISFKKILFNRQKYNEYVHCLKMNKRDEDACALFKGFYGQVCPTEWVRETFMKCFLIKSSFLCQTDNWNDQRAAGVFPGVQLDPLPALLKKH
jgi:hypothetical protein